MFLWRCQENKHYAHNGWSVDQCCSYSYQSKMKWTKTRCFDIKFIGFSHRLIVFVVALNEFVIVVLSARTRVKQTIKCKHKWHTSRTIYIGVITHLYEQTQTNTYTCSDEQFESYFFVRIRFISFQIYYYYIILHHWIHIVRNHEIHGDSTHTERISMIWKFILFTIFLCCT